MLPKASKGVLPNLDTPYDAHYVSLATGTRVDFVPPSYELIKTIHENNLIPVLSIRLSGKDYWGALLFMDRSSGIAWFRIETSEKIEKSIQLLFDASKSRDLKNDILSNQLVPLPLEYLNSMVNHSSEPVIVLSKDGLASALPDKFNPEALQDIKKTIAFISRHRKPAETVPGPEKKLPFSDYTAYVKNVSRLKALLKPTETPQNLFPTPGPLTSPGSWSSRMKQFEEILKKADPLRDHDRIALAYILASNDHVHSAPDLFVRLAAKKTLSMDSAACQDSFIIGQQLFLLGHYEEAFNYLELSFFRHPFFSKYEMWYQLATLKLKKTPLDFYSPPAHQPYLNLYYKTISDIESGNSEVALKRLEKAHKKDSHDSLVNHLLHKYFNKPLDEKYFFPVQEGF